MRLVLIVFLCAALAGLSGCGKRPSELETPAGSLYPRIYPADPF